MNAVNKVTFKQKLQNYIKNPASLCLFILVCVMALISVAVFLYMVIYIFVKGIPYIKPQLFAMKYTSDNVSLMPALINTVTMTLASLLIALPLGILSAVYLVEYARPKSKLVAAVRLTSETLSGIPSIVFGLFGMLMFVTAFRWGYSMLAGAFTLAIMILPLIMRTTEEALRSVPVSFREGSFALGAGRLRTVFAIILPAAMPGILSGVILAIGRVVGETAALIYTSGTVAQIPKNLMGSGRTLAVHMFALSSEGFHINEAYATGVILLIIVFFINRLSNTIAKKLSKGKKQ